MTPLELVLARLEGVRECGEGYQALCPAHEDREPSLSVSEGTDGRVLLHCHAGCTFESVLLAMGLVAGDLSPGSARTSGDPRKTDVVQTYDYEDEHGSFLFQVVRSHPKAFHQRRPAPIGTGWIWDTKGVRRVPYRLPALIEDVALGKTVFIAEGEKDVDRLVSLGFSATCNVGGAGKWRDEYSRFLTGADVVILPDNDSPGRKHAGQVALSVHPHARSVKVVPLPDLREKGDVSDWLDAGHTVHELLSLVEGTPGYDPDAGRSAGETPPRHGRANGVGLTEQLAAEIATRFHFARDGADRLFVFHGGVYVADGHKLVAREVKRALARRGQEWSTYRSGQVVRYIVTDAAELWSAPPSDVISVRNGLLRVSPSRHELEPHTPQHLSTVQLPVVYNPAAACPAVARFIADVFPDEQTRTLAWEIFGWLMVPDRSLQKAVLLIGDGGATARARSYTF